MKYTKVIQCHGFLRLIQAYGRIKLYCLFILKISVTKFNSISTAIAPQIYMLDSIPNKIHFSIFGKVVYIILT